MKLVMLADVPGASPVTGVAVHTLGLLRGLSQQTEVDRIFLVTTGHHQRSSHLPNKVEVLNMEPRLGRGIWGLPLVPLLWRSIASAVSRVSPDYVHVQGVSPVYSGAVLFAPNRRNWFLTIHGIVSREWAFYPPASIVAAPISIGWERIALQLYPNVILPSKGLAGYLPISRSSRSHYIPHGAPDFANHQETQARGPWRQAVFLGSLSRLKAVDLLLRAFATLPHAAMHSRLVIAGSGTEEGRLKRLAANLGISDRVTWLGPVAGPEKEELLRNADAIVLSSRWESSPVVIIEAMAHRRAVVAPGFAGISSMLTGYSMSFEYRPGSMEDLAAKMRAALTSVRETPLRDGSYDDYNLISWDGVAKLTLRAYESADNQRKNRSG